MATAVDATLNAHLKECAARYEQLVKRADERHLMLSIQIDSLRHMMLLGGGSLVLGLFSIIGILLHNGGHF